MARNVFVVNATQVVVSEQNPQGLYSVMNGYPKQFDSNSSTEEAALKAAKSAYFDQVGKNYGDTNPNRVMMTVTLEMADGRQIMRDSFGAFPVVQPEPEPEPEEEPEEQ